MPLMRSVPAVGASRSAMARRKVVLPQPEGPMKETNSPFSMVRFTSERAWTGPSPVAKVRLRCSAETTGAGDEPSCNLAAVASIVSVNVWPFSACGFDLVGEQFAALERDFGDPPAIGRFD